jgi:hypothetical protein
MRWMGYATRMGEIGNAYKILAEKREKINDHLRNLGVRRRIIL